VVGLDESIDDLTQFEWHDTELIKRQNLTVVVVMVVILSVLYGLAFTGFLSMIIAIIMSLVILGAGGIGFFSGNKEVLERDPTHVGLSANGIRLRYHDGRYKYFPWKDVGGVVYTGSSSPTKIIHRDGGFTNVVLPKTITAEMERKFQEIRKVRAKEGDVPFKDEDKVRTTAVKVPRRKGGPDSRVLSNSQKRFMNEAEYDWFDTRLYRQLEFLVFAVAIAVLLLAVLLFVTGLIANFWIVIVAMTIIAAIVLAYYFGTIHVLKKNPMSIGLSDAGIRLLYNYGQHKDILWGDIDDILVQVVQGKWATFRIIHEDSSFMPLSTPVKISDEINSRYQEYKSQRAEGQRHTQ
jgi:hypothetical protein